MAATRAFLGCFAAFAMMMVLGALSVSACGKSGSDKAEPAAEGSKSPAAPSAAGEPSADTIWLSIDGRRLASINADAFRQKTELSEIPGVPRKAAWKQLTVTDGGKRTLVIAKVKEKYPKHRVLFYEADGEPAVGVFPPPVKDGPKSVQGKPVLKLQGVMTLDIVTQAVPERAPQVAEFHFQPKGAGPVVIRLDGKEPTTAAPDGDEATGWHLRDLLEGQVDASASPALELVAGDKSVDVPAGILRSKDHVLFIKINRKGLLRFRWYDVTGKEAVERGELRGVELVRAL